VPASRSDQSLLTAGRQLAVDVDAHPELAQHGFASAQVTAIVAAFEATCGEIGTGHAAFSAAVARIGELLATGVSTTPAGWTRWS
jgi:hypothetical protein